MEIRFLQPEDDPAEISRIYEESWKYAYRGIIPQDYLDSIPEGRWVSSLTREGVRHLVLLEGSRMIGTASVSRSRWEQHSGCGEIISLYFLPEYIGKGYGGHLLQRCVTELQQMGYREILLWVLEDNARARRFYEKHGFRCTGEYLDDTIGGKALREVLYTISCEETLLEE